MAEKAETVEFWKGVVIGTLVGLTAAAYARGEFRRLLSFASAEEPELAAPPHAPLSSLSSSDAKAS